MDKITEFLPTILGVLIFLIIWFVLRRILSSLSDKINNSEVYKEDVLNVLEEIRDELKKLNQNNISK
ncbi:hypothetical protein [Flavobacterium sp. HJJ]|uniref:hypothetical protein n=1 Tax=Flavobacterium sp. HJJ TaxID=2783792 RepID=UPI00188B2B45|nr:hypothetical protein [Flavobacterium sp. HJJ]MBF4472345.1 hypothetical protein [Flavobacterium sp. HJJ]